MNRRWGMEPYPLEEGIPEAAKPGCTLVKGQAVAQKRSPHPYKP